jgi:HlyD family secretion protein
MMQTTTGNSVQSTSKRSGQSLLLAIAAAFALGGATIFAVQQFQATSTTDSSEQVPVIDTVTALGRLVPQGELINLAAPTASNESRIAQLLVEEGDVVEAGDVIAVLDSRSRLQEALNQAQQDVRVARAQLDQVLAGAQTGELQAQQAEIARLEAERAGQLNEQSANVARLEAEVQNAQVEYNRYQTLYQEGSVSASERDARRLTLATAQRQLQEARAALERIRNATQEQIDAARATLDQIAEVRPTDVETATAEVARAVASRDQAQASLEEAYVRSPQPGTVLKIYARPGEVVSSETGVADIGQTSQMYAIAEVYQSDISKVEVGQRARITSSALPDVELMGTVAKIGSIIERQDVINADPTDNIDSRVVEVDVRLDPESSQRVEGYTNLQVKVVIER